MLTNSQIDDILTMCKNGIFHRIIAAKHGVCTSRVGQISKENGLPPRPKERLSIVEQLQMVEDYKTMGVAALKNKYKMHKTHVIRYLRKYGQTILPKGLPSHIPIDKEFFYKMDRLEKFWLLGWLYSDGYNNEKSYGVALCVHNQDMEVLYKIKTLLKSEHPIYTETKIKRSNFRFNCKAISRDLAGLGCVQAKSLILEYPHFLLDTKEKTCAFLRGFIEGDGSIMLTQHKTCNTKLPQIAIACASPKFVYTIQEIFVKMWNLHGVISGNSKRKITKIAFKTNQQNILKCLNDIYNLDQCPYYLDRKYKKYLEVKQYIEEHTKLDNIKYEKRKLISDRPITSCKAKTFYLKKNNMIYQIRGRRRFEVMERFGQPKLLKILNKQHTNRCAWSLPSDDEIKLAKENNTLDLTYSV